jgi:hypothetical protein
MKKIIILVAANLVLVLLLVGPSLALTITPSSDAELGPAPKLFEAEGRIGDTVDGAPNRTFEVDIGPTTSAPAATQNLTWGNGLFEPFILTYNPATGIATFQVNNNPQLSFDTGLPGQFPSTVFIRVRAVDNANDTMSLTNLFLDGMSIPDQNTSGALDKVVVKLTGSELNDGFSLTGNATMSWLDDLTDRPWNSQLAFQLVGANPVPLPPSALLLGSGLLGLVGLGFRRRKRQ